MACACALPHGGVPEQELLPPADEAGEGAPLRNVVAADGRIFEQFQTYRELLRSGISDILGEAAAANFVLKVQAPGLFRLLSWQLLPCSGQTTSMHLKQGNGCHVRY